MQTGELMRFLVISDIHGNLENIEKLSPEFEKADAVLFAGDFAEFGKAETGEPVLNLLCKKHDQIFSVLGNCDEPEFLSALEGKDISVQKMIAFFEGLSVCGSGGGSKFTGTTPFERTDEELVSDFSCVDSGEKWHNLIAIMHNPPKDTACDMISNGMHVGSPLLREFIEKTEPLAVITGHIHESAGIETLSNTIVINPGALAEGKYAILEVSKENGNWKVDSAVLKNL